MTLLSDAPHSTNYLHQMLGRTSEFFVNLFADPHSGDSESVLEVSNEATAYFFQHRTLLFNNRTEMKQYQPKAQDLFTAQSCRNKALCGIDLQNKYMSYYFFKYKHAALPMQHSIGYYNFDDNEMPGKDALDMAGRVSTSTKSQVPLLWMPSNASAMLEDFESSWNQSDTKLLPACILLSVSMGPLFLLALLVLCAPLAPLSCRRRFRRCQAKIFDRKNVYAAAQDYINASDSGSGQSRLVAGLDPLAPTHHTGPSPSRLENQAGSDRHNHFPSCTWRGYYKQYGSRHNLCSFDLHFSAEAFGRLVIGGRGQDDIGRYEIDGEWSPATMRISFVKEYELGSQNIHDRIDWRENKGHRVLYTGKAGSTPGQGFKGTWSLDVNSFRDQGEFHLWPEELPALSQTWFRMPEPSAPPLELGAVRGTELQGMQASAPPLQVYEATPDGVCVVCLDRKIGVALAPCGHIAVCSYCAGRLSAQCPICRRPVEHVIPCR